MADYTLEGFRVVLETSRNLPGISAVPFLHEAASIALRILSIVRDVRSRNQAFNDLASDSCGLVYTVVVECRNIKKEGHEVPERVQIHIASLARNLAAIEKFARKKVDRAILKKIILHSKDLDEIARYRQVLRQSLDVFGIQANISIQENLQRILDGIERRTQELKTDRGKYEDEQRRAEEELASRLEILRIQQEEREARAQEEMEDVLRQERALERERKREERRRKDEETYDGKSDTAKSPEADDISQARKNRLHSSDYYQYPIGPFYSPYFYPGSPYLYPGYSIPPYPIPAPMPSVTNITGGATSRMQSTVHVTSYNSGNVTNSIIKNSMNSYSSKKKSVSTKADDSDDDSDDGSDSDLSDDEDDWFRS